MSDYPDPIITNTAIIFNLVKPIFGSVFSIYDKWLKIAKERKLIMIVKTPFGVATYLTAQDWIRGAKLIKKYHNFEEPMKMWSRSVLPDIKKRAERKKLEKRLEATTNSVMNAMARLKRKEPQMFEEVRRKLGLR